ncbi:MAG: thioredoxin family protein [Candidatus Korarchaeum sp.]|nr:thioredoxin family protein [Candidatus Korarchaeum sp.]MDW8036282.1 hypothetical protein [Candidatus Korarchaeum sp.]
MEDEVEGKEVKELILLVSPICRESLEAAVELRRWASARGYSLKEVSVLESEGLRMIENFGIRRIPAAIFNGKLLFQGSIPSDLDSLLNR